MDRETLIGDLAHVAGLYAKDKSVPQTWRDQNPPEVSWEELHSVSALCLRAAAALAAETARADREAAARQEAEREGNAMRASHDKWRDDCIKAESAWGELTAERDRLRAELAATREALAALVA